MSDQAMSPNALAITLYCSQIHTDEKTGKALNTKEWASVAKILMSMQKQPKDIVTCTAEELSMMGIPPELATRLPKLAERTVGLGLKLHHLNGNGIKVVTRADDDYPKIFKRKLSQNCPPLFYYVGDPALFNEQNMAVGIVGSRSIGDNDIAYVRQMVKKFVDRGFTIVSGGAKGVDTEAVNAALEFGGKVIIYTADKLDGLMHRKKYTTHVIDKRVLLVSVHNPEVGFSNGIAMMRNRFIYLSSQATLVVKSDANKGGTWAGATECLKKGYAFTLCRNTQAQGNQLLIQQGAIPVNDDWDGDVLQITNSQPFEWPAMAQSQQPQPQQLTLLGDELP